ncbi:MAG: 4Fe-4S binding protein [Armatimonadota bacterium]|nr:4Fe-4S binding protein [bacterium]MDW8320943.1 4Fe-4S binding protein [Armatimonadota bacterium]
MAYVIAEPCIGVKDKACVAVCPVDCIKEGVFTDNDGTSYDMLFINPDECIDCGLCEPECPVSAIFAETDVPSQWQHFIRINREAFASGQVGS